MTGVIYLAIIALWAAVLIPIWLRRNDADEIRAVDRFEGAMSALGRFRGGEGAQASSAAARRRLVVSALAAVAGVLAVLWLIGFAPVILPLLAAVLLGGYLVLARRQALRERQAARRTRSRRTEAAPSRQQAARRRTAPERREALERGQQREPRGGGPQDRAPRRRRPQSYEERAGYREERRAADVPVYDGAREFVAVAPDDSWDPVPQTLPRYVDAPSASAIPRSIERDGVWDAGAMLERAREQRAAATEFFDQYADDSAEVAPLPHRRAAGA